MEQKCNSEAVVAYKDCNGHIHSTCQAADKATKEIQKQIKEAKIKYIFYNVIKEYDNRTSYSHCHTSGIHISNVPNLFVPYWKTIRDALNAIEE